jgi:hypothetical protein
VGSPIHHKRVAEELEIIRLVEQSPLSVRAVIGNPDQVTASTVKVVGNNINRRTRSIYRDGNGSRASLSQRCRLPFVQNFVNFPRIFTAHDRPVHSWPGESGLNHRLMNVRRTRENCLEGVPLKRAESL